MSMAQKLELNWIGKHDPKNKISPEPRILVENPEYSYSNSEAIVNEQLSFEEKNKIYFDNMLIHGDNLLALKSLELEYAGKIKCIYIDPPYNTGSAFEHYDDNLEHSAWLNLMKPRIELLKCLLSKNGIICIQIDDSPNSATGQSPEKAYLQILMDEVFGRKNYITNLVWKRKEILVIPLEHLALLQNQFLCMQRIKNTVKLIDNILKKHINSKMIWELII